jgi:hypothetical protein
MPKTGDVIPEKNTKSGRRWFLPGLILFFLTLTVFVIAAIILFGRQKSVITKKFEGEVSVEQGEISPESSAASKIFRAKIPPAPSGQIRRRPNRVQPANNSIRADASKNTEKKDSVKAGTSMTGMTIGQKNSKQSAAVQTTQPIAAPISKSSQQKRALAKNSAVSKKTTPAKRVPSGKPAKKNKKNVKTRIYDRIDDSKLKLQALAWFNDAAKRMAVINSRIVREGGTVDGYQVTEIRRQDVVINDGKKSWRLEFALKQSPLN